MTDIEDLTKLANLRPKKEYEIKDENYDKYVSIVKELWKITYEDNKHFLLILRQLRKIHKISPKMSKLLFIYRELVNKQNFKENPSLKFCLITKKVRRLSGVMVITVLTSPYPTYKKNGKIKSRR